MNCVERLYAYFEQHEIDTLELEELLTVSLVLLDDLYQEHVPDSVQHRSGPSSRFADSEVLTLSWVGEMLGVDSEHAWYHFVQKEYAALFPHLPERSRFNRRRRNLWWVSDLLRQKLLEQLPQGDILLVDSLPIPVCDFKRANFSTNPLKGQGLGGLRASYGHCATKGLGTFLGFRLHVLTSQQGIPICFVLANADIDDREVLPQMAAQFPGCIIIGDKGYVSEPLRQEFLQGHDIQLLAQKRSNQKPPYTPYLKRTIHRLRKRVEVTYSQLTDQFHVSRVRARSHWGLRTRIGDKLAAFTLGIFLNQGLGRPLMALKNLVFA